MPDFQTGFQIGMVIGFTLFMGIYFLRSAIINSRPSAGEVSPLGSVTSDLDRIRRAEDARDRVSVPARYIVSIVSFGCAAAILLKFFSPGIAYALVFLTLVVRCVGDQIAEERAPRRRSAVLGRSRRIDPVFLIWMAIAIVASFMLVPWIVDAANRGATIVVAVCVWIMLLVAWRIATAPPLLSGDDLAAEQIIDSETRAIRTGNTCLSSVSVILFYVCFMEVSAPLMPSFRNTFPALVVVWLGLFAWKTLYARRLARTPLPS